MNDIKDMVKEEVNNLLSSFDKEIQDPDQKLAFARMAKDLTMLPIRMAQGEDVSLLFKSISAEAALYGSAFALKSQAIVQQAWMNIAFKLVTKVLLA